MIILSASLHPDVEYSVDDCIHEVLFNVSFFFTLQLENQAEIFLTGFDDKTWLHITLGT